MAGSIFLAISVYMLRYLPYTGATSSIFIKPNHQRNQRYLLYVDQRRRQSPARSLIPIPLHVMPQPNN